MSQSVNDDLIYHCCPRAAWDEAQGLGEYVGSADDTRDGFIHFSTFAQVRTSTAKHRAGQAGLVLLVVRSAKLGAALKWEPSRGDMHFPHLYGALPIDAVTQAIDLPLDAGGMHIFPDGYPALEADPLS